jgi:hypothetical protein
LSATSRYTFDEGAITGALTYVAWFRADAAHTGSLVSRRTTGDTANDIASRCETTAA